MHRTPLSRTQGTRRTSAGNHRTGALKNWLSRHWTPGRGTHGPGRRAGLCNGCDRPRRRSFIHRTRSSLRNNHARSRRLWRPRNHWNRTRRRHWSMGRGRSRNRGRCRYRWRWRNHRRCRRRYQPRRCSNRRCGRRRRWSQGGSHGGHGPFCRWSNHFRPRSWRRRWSFRCRNRRRRGRWRWSCRRSRGRNHRLCRNWSHCGPRRRRDGFLLLGNGFQHISRPGNMRQIDLGLDFLFTAQGTRGPGRRSLRFGRAANMDSHFFGFMLLE
jgi:hypothetical protein